MLVPYLERMAHFFIMKEFWKDIKGYEGLYQVSNLGRVKSLDRVVNGKKLKGRFISLNVDTKKYLFVWLNNGNKKKMFRVHRLVANMFIPLIEGKEYVDHINGKRDDNRVENLRWCTHQENDNFHLSRLHRSQSKIGNKFFLGKHHSQETKDKISMAHKGLKNPNYWKNLSEENKQKIKRASIEACRVEVDQYNTNGLFIKTWQSMADIERELGLPHGNIRKCCVGKYKTCGGFIWKYHKKTFYTS